MFVDEFINLFLSLILFFILSHLNLFNPCLLITLYDILCLLFEVFEEQVFSHIPFHSKGFHNISFVFSLLSHSSMDYLF